MFLNQWPTNRLKGADQVDKPDGFPLPLPRSMERTAGSKPVYETEAMVARIQADASGAYQIAVRFRNASSKAHYQEAS